MKLTKLTTIFDNECEAIINCDKELVLDNKTLYTGSLKILENSVLRDGQVRHVTIVDTKLVIDLSLDYATLVKYLFEQNSKLANKIDGTMPTLKENSDEQRKAD